MTVKEANAQKKWLSCLRCGEQIWTDRCHRFCRRCRIAIQRFDYRIPDSYSVAGDSVLSSAATELYE
jgi:hypothetical protein